MTVTWFSTAAVITVLVATISLQLSFAYGSFVLRGGRWSVDAGAAADDGDISGRSRHLANAPELPPPSPSLIRRLTDVEAKEQQQLAATEQGEDVGTAGGGGEDAGGAMSQMLQLQNEEEEDVPVENIHPAVFRTNPIEELTIDEIPRTVLLPSDVDDDDGPAARRRRERLEEFFREVEAIKQSIAGNALYAADRDDDDAESDGDYEEDYYADDVSPPASADDVQLPPDSGTKQVSTWMFNPFSRVIQHRPQHPVTASKRSTVGRLYRRNRDSCDVTLRQAVHESCQHVSTGRLPLAMETLCRTHRICIACGSLYGPSSHVCDVSFRRAAGELCTTVDRDVIDCRAEAERQILGVGHRRPPATLPATFGACAQTCARFLPRGMNGRRSL